MSKLNPLALSYINSMFNSCYRKLHFIAMLVYIFQYPKKTYGDKKIMLLKFSGKASFTWLTSNRIPAKMMHFEKFIVSIESSVLCWSSRSSCTESFSSWSGELSRSSLKPVKFDLTDDLEPDLDLILDRKLDLNPDTSGNWEELRYCRLSGKVSRTTPSSSGEKSKLLRGELGAVSLFWAFFLLKLFSSSQCFYK